MGHRVGSRTVLFAFVMMATFLTYGVQTFGLKREAFDDQYLNCQKDMEIKLAEDKVLDNEIKNNEKLKIAWKFAKILWTFRKKDLKSKIPSGFKSDHGIALLTYTSETIRKDVDNAVKSVGKSYRNYMNNFGFKWLHFYVTTALQLLAQSEMGKVTKVYGRTKEVTQLIGVNRLKFGHFLYTTKNENHTALRGEKSVLTLFTYHGVNIEDFSANPCEEEVLVPGFEVFTLSPGKMELNSTRKYCSDFNCAYISGEVPKKPNPDCI